MKPSKYQAFTLVELLVVISIIAILAAILFPVFENAREKARQSACLVNLKQFGTAFQQYIQDADGMLPACINGDPNGAKPTWDAQVYPYVKSTEVFQCPDDPTDPNGYRPRVPMNYVANYNLIYKPAGIAIRTGAAELDIAQPSEVIEIFERYNYSTIAGLSDPTSIPANMAQPGWLSAGPNVDWVAPNYFTNPQDKSTRHDTGQTGMGNYLACDGHAKYLPLDSVSFANNNPASKRNVKPSQLQQNNMQMTIIPMG